VRLRRGWRRRAAGLVLAALLVVAGAGALWLRAALWLPARPGDAAPVLVDVRPGMRLSEIARLLQRSGVVRSALGFELLGRRRGLAGALQAGTYALTPAMTPGAVLAAIASGDVAAIRVTVPEGDSARQVLAALAVAGLSAGSALARAVNDPALLASAGLPAPAPGVITALEGYLFPATYAFAPDATPQAMLGTMLAQFSAVWTPALAQAALHNAGLNTAQAVTLASIVQREVASPAQMAIVAGVYLNRLRLGMDLDADPTVLYALGLEGQQGPLTNAQLSVDSPYNTYRHAGLPPGPICNPGAAALQAVAHPATTTALYFLTAPDGQLVLADTLAEQEANVQAYLGG